MTNQITPTDAATLDDFLSQVAEALGFSPKPAPDPNTAKMTSGIGLGVMHHDEGAEIVIMQDETSGASVVVAPADCRQIAIVLLAAADTAEIMEGAVDAAVSGEGPEHHLALANGMNEAVARGVKDGVLVEVAVERVFNFTRDKLFGELQERYRADIGD